MRPATGEVCTNCGGILNWTSAPGQLPMGTLLRGAAGHTYQVGAVRGQGGFGITYAAMDLTNGQRVAIKEYYPTRCAMRTQLNQVTPMTGQNDVYQGGMKSFLEEAMMLSAVGALPSVVSVKDYFEANGTAYLVMEFVDGVPLHQIVSRKGRMSADELLPKLPELLLDLDTLHKAGVIHRDISPDNLILMPDGKLKLLDFGSARSVQDGKSMTVLLKAGFSPVEQYQSRGQGPWTDVYALAGTIYYCLTGVIPPSAVERLDDDSLQKPNALGAGLTLDQEDALLCGLIVQPKSRPASMDLFRQRLFPEPVCGGKYGIPPIDPLSKLKDTVGDTMNAAKAAAKDAVATAKDAVESAKEAVAAKAAQAAAEQAAQSQDVPPTAPAEEAPVTTPEQIPPVISPDPVVTEPSPVPPRPLQQKKFDKKLILIAIAALVAIALVIWGVLYLVTHGTTDDGFVYELDLGDYATITGYEGNGGAVTIPKKIRDLPVNYIDNYAFEDRRDITTLTVTTNVYPFNSSFSGCSGITTAIFDGPDVNISGWSSELRDMNSLRCVLFTDEGKYRNCIDKNHLKNLTNVAICYKGQDTGYGLIRSVEVADGIPYAITSAQNAFVLRLPEGVDGDRLSPMLGSYQVILPDGRIPGQKDPVYGETDDGYSYMISANRQDCVITGYNGDESILYIPDEIEGVAVNQIGEDAFAGNTTVVSVFFPLELSEIMGNAFKNCTDLKDLYLYSSIAYADTAFAGCDALRCAVLENENAAMSIHNISPEFKIYNDGMETGIGKLDYVGVSTRGTIYGITHDERAVVLDIPDNTTELELVEEVYDIPLEWVYKGALNGVSSSAVIHLPANTLFPYHLYNAVDWEFLDNKDTYTPAECWYYTSYLRAMILEKRGTEIDSSEELLSATMLRANELSVSNSYTRPNGESWSSVLDEYKIEWSYASTWKTSYVGDQFEEFLENIEWLAETYAAPEEDHDNKYYSSIALAFYFDKDSGTTYLSCIAAMNE